MFIKKVEDLYVKKLLNFHFDVINFYHIINGYLFEKKDNVRIIKY